MQCVGVGTTGKRFEIEPLFIVYYHKVQNEPYDNVWCPKMGQDLPFIIESEFF